MKDGGVLGKKDRWREVEIIFKRLGSTLRNGLALVGERMEEVIHDPEKPGLCI